jgi:hypothetical protein
MSYQPARPFVDGTSDVDVKIDIITPLKEAYYRNNRTSGQKSLRCFPDCCIGKGHEVHAFCGRSFVCKATLSLNYLENHKSYTEMTEEILICHTMETRPLPSCWVGKIPTFIMQIRPEYEAYLLKSTIIDEATLIKNLRDGANGASFVIRKDETTGVGPEECYHGTISKMTRFYSDKFDRLELEIVFNVKLASWDYSWKSNRWSCDTLHNADILAYKHMENTKTLKLLNYVSSSLFQIIGTKVSRSALEKEKLRKLVLNEPTILSDTDPTRADTAATSSKHAIEISNNNNNETEQQETKRMRMNADISRKSPKKNDEDKRLKGLISESMRDIYAIIKKDKEINTNEAATAPKRELKNMAGSKYLGRNVNLDQMIIGELTEKKILKLLDYNDSDKNIYEIYSTVKGWVPSVRYKEVTSSRGQNNSRDVESTLPPFHVPRITASKEFVYDNLRLYQSLHATTYGINPLLVPQAPKLPTDIIIFPQKYKQSSISDVKKVR